MENTPPGTVIIWLDAGDVLTIVTSDVCPEQGKTFGTTTETEMLVSRPSLRSTETENCKSHPGTVIIRLEARDADDGMNGEVRYGFARCDFLLVVLSDLGVERSSVVCSFCAIAAAVPPRPQDGTACFSHRTLHHSVQLCDRL